MIRLTISIINFKTKELTGRCLDSILAKTWKTSYQICLVDNDSRDGSVEYFKRKYPQVTLIESKENLGFAGGHNLVLKKLNTDYVLILNSDVEVLDKSLDNLVEFMEEEDFAIAGCLLLNKDGSFQPSGGDLPTLFPVFIWISGLDDILPIIRKHIPSLHRKFRNYYDGGNVSWVGGTAMMVKKEVLEKIGYLDDKIFMYAEDIEFCLRAQKCGFKLGWTNNASMVHLGGASTKDAQFRQWLGEYKGLIYVYQKHFSILSQIILIMLIYIFTLVRILAFAVVGKLQVSKTYAKVFANL